MTDFFEIAQSLILSAPIAQKSANDALREATDKENLETISKHDPANDHALGIDAPDDYLYEEDKDEQGRLAD